MKKKKKKVPNPSYLLTVKLLQLKPSHKRQLGHPGKKIKMNPLLPEEVVIIDSGEDGRAKIVQN